VVQADAVGRPRRPRHRFDELQRRAVWCVGDPEVDRAIGIAGLANLEVVVEHDREVESELGGKVLDRGFEIRDDDADVVESGIDHRSRPQMMAPSSLSALISSHE
jgi:hypothetical protein